MAIKQRKLGPFRTPGISVEQTEPLLDRLLDRMNRSSSSAQWKTHLAASKGLNDPSTAARTLKVAPGRVNQLIRAGAVRLHAVDDRYQYVRVKEVRQALAEEMDSLQE